MRTLKQIAAWLIVVTILAAAAICALPLLITFGFVILIVWAFCEVMEDPG